MDMIHQKDLALILVILEVGFFLKDYKEVIVGRALLVFTGAVRMSS